MLRELIERKRTAVRNVSHTVRGWLHPTTSMKGHAFDRPLDDLGQNIDDVEQRTSAAQGSGASEKPSDLGAPARRSS